MPRRRTHPNAPRTTSLAGSYCHACGQHAHVHKSLLHLGEGGTYTLGRWPAAWRAGALMLIAGIVFALYMALILILSVK